MKRRTVTALVLAQTALMVLFGWIAAYLGRDEFRLVTAALRADAPPRAVAPDTPGALPVLRLAPSALASVGIESAPVAASTGSDPATGAGDLVATVVDLPPLIELQGRLHAARAEADAAQAAASASARERRRVQALYDDDRNASQRALDAAIAQALADAAHDRSAAAALVAAQAGARSAWGPAIAAALAGGERGGDLGPDRRAARRPDRLWADLLAGRAALLRVALRADDAAPAPRQIAVASPTAGQPVVARLVAAIAPAAATGDTTAIAGRQALYLASAAGYAPGMRVAAGAVGARSRGGDPEPAGVSVPPSAIVWHAGEPWVYVRLATDAASAASAPAAARKPAGRDDDDDDHAPASKPAVAPPAATAATPAVASASAGTPAAPALVLFQRRAVPSAERRGAGWFLPGFDPHATVVIHGAQVLLSEELRSLSHDDDD